MTWHALSLGAGVNSTALLHWLIEHKQPLDEVIFADTGAEKPETYDYIEKWIKPFLQAKGIPYARVANRITLQERCLHGHTIPDRHFRWSTRDFKIRPINKHLKPHFPAIIYLGIAFDEVERIKKEYNEPGVTRAWPLCDAQLTRRDCELILIKQGWPIPVKSGCWFCPYMRVGEIRWLWEVHPDLFGQGMVIEKNGSKYPNFTLRQGTTWEELRNRFIKEKEEAARAERLNTKLDLYLQQEECEGFCMT